MPLDVEKYKKLAALDPNKYKAMSTPTAQMPDANAMLKSGLGKLGEWATTSLTGIHEPTMEDWYKNPADAARRAGIAGMTTPVSIAGEFLGGAGLLAKRAGLIGKTAKAASKAAEITPELSRARNIIEAYEGADALKGKSPEEIIKLADSLDPLKYPQSDKPLRVDFPKQEGEMPAITLDKYKGGSTYDDKLIAEMKDEIRKTRNLEFVNPDEPPNTRLRRIAAERKAAEAASKKPKLRANLDGTFTNIETGEVIEAPKAPKEIRIGPRETATANEVNIHSGNIPNMRQPERISAQMVGNEPPTVTLPNDKPFVSVGPMATEQAGMGFGKGPRTLEHVAPDENVSFQSVGQVPSEQTSMGFGKDAPPPNFNWGDWWKGTSKSQKALDIYGAGNRAIQSSLDISWPLRQGRKIIHTKAWRDGVKEGLKAFKSEEDYVNAMAAIKSDPVFETAQKSGVDFTELTSKLGKREEQFQSPLAEHIPVLGKGIRASGRSYTVMGNKARLEFFKSVTLDPNVDKVAAADLVNTLTGRSKLPTKNLERAAPALNQFLYSPKALYSNMKVLNPYTYIKAPKGVRKEYVYSALQMIGTTFAVNNIAEAAGAKVTWNPTSSDFGKIVIGNTHLDPMGGVQQPLVLAAKLLKGEKTTIGGKTTKLGSGFGKDSAFDVMADFGRSKLAPWPGAVINTIGGEDPVGNETNAGKELLKLYTPLITQDLYEVAQDNPAMAPIVASLVGVGVGQATYQTKGKKGNLFSVPKIKSPSFKKIKIR